MNTNPHNARGCDHRHIDYVPVADSYRTGICPLTGREGQTYRQRCPRCDYERTVMTTASSFATGYWSRRFDAGTSGWAQHLWTACEEEYRRCGWATGAEPLRLAVVHTEHPPTSSWRVELCGSVLATNLPLAISRSSEIDALRRAQARTEDLTAMLVVPLRLGTAERTALIDAYLAGEDAERRPVPVAWPV